jgi:hypothetical protein
MEELYENNNYPSFTIFKSILKENGIKKTEKEIKEFIASQTVSQLHKPQVNIKEKNKYIVSLTPNEEWQCDLLDYQKYAKTNNGYKFIFICIDIFTRFAYCEPIKNKTPEELVKAIKKFEVLPYIFYSDSGNEFKGVFKKYLHEMDILDIQAQVGDHFSLGIVDRFSKTLKNMIAKYMTAKKTTKYIDNIQNFMNIYNNTPHRSLNNIKPNMVTESKDNMLVVTSINVAKQEYNKSLYKKEKEKIKVGDSVRIKKSKNLFEKGYEITYSKEIYTVEKIENTSAILNNGNKYKISDLLIVPKNSLEYSNTEKEKVEKENKIEKKIKQVGLSENDIVKEKRVRKKKEVFDI